MTTPFIGEIQLFGFTYAPYQWSLCNGATVGIRQNSTLYALIGVAYGGDGTNTFNLPNLFESANCSQGQGPGLTSRVVGEPFGTPSVSLGVNEMPAHTHLTATYNARGGTTKTPAPSAGAYLTPNVSNTFLVGPPNAVLAPGMIQNTGGSVPHENRQPFLALNYSIALAGAFPSFG
jgi:microcystin-dependent protein